jgi:hypothetical protein
METAPLDSFRQWARFLPRSRMVYPNTWRKRLKYAFWRFYTPFHPYLRDAALAVGIVWQTPGRQKFLLGTIAPGYTLQDVTQHFIDRGYANHFVAWEDEDEVLSLRHVENFEYQYHIRIFKDGEIRGHYEYTPECHPMWHMQEVGLEDRREHFYTLLGEKITPAAPNT